MEKIVLHENIFLQRSCCVTDLITLSREWDVCDPPASETVSELCDPQNDGSCFANLQVRKGGLPPLASANGATGFFKTLSQPSCMYVEVLPRHSPSPLKRGQATLP